MPKRKFGEKKDPFDALEEEWKDAIARMEESGIRDRIATTALDQATLMGAKDTDIDFQKARETAKEAGAVYRDGTKINKLKIAFAKRVLEDRGKQT